MDHQKLAQLSIEAFRIIRALLDIYQGAASGKESVDAARRRLKKLRDTLATHDAAADARLKERFGKG